MGEADRYTEYKRNSKNKILLGQENNALVGLFTLNVIFFLLLLTIEVTYYYFQENKGLFNAQVVQYFLLPAQLVKLSERPWTILTYMFTHTTVMQMLSNMLWLWTFGYIMQDLTGNKKLIPIYMYGGWAGALFFITTSLIVDPHQTTINDYSLVGANIPIIAVATAIVTLAPRYKILRNIGNGIPVWPIVLVYLLINLLSVSTLPLPFIIAHIGGALSGVLFIYFLRKGKDGSVWMNNFYHWSMNVFNPNKPAQKSAKEDFFYNTQGTTPYSKKSRITQQRVDEILDKINQKGYHFLTNEEKDILKKASEEDL